MLVPCDLRPLKSQLIGMCSPDPGEPIRNWAGLGSSLPGPGLGNVVSGIRRPQVSGAGDVLQHREKLTAERGRHEDETSDTAVS